MVAASKLCLVSLLHKSVPLLPHCLPIRQKSSRSATVLRRWAEFQTVQTDLPAARVYTLFGGWFRSGIEEGQDQGHKEFWRAIAAHSSCDRTRKPRGSRHQAVDSQPPPAQFCQLPCRSATPAMLLVADPQPGPARLTPLAPVPAGQTRKRLRGRSQRLPSTMPPCRSTRPMAVAVGDEGVAHAGWPSTRWERDGSTPMQPANGNHDACGSWRDGSASLRACRPGSTRSAKGRRKSQRMATNDRNVERPALRLTDGCEAFATAAYATRPNPRPTGNAGHGQAPAATKPKSGFSDRFSLTVGGDFRRLSPRVFVC